jgi:PKHD-type hydroxylase
VQIPPADKPSVLRYDAGSADHFRSHRDSGTFSSTRKLTFIVQLSPSDAYSGCDLVFSDVGEIATRQQGALIVFPTFEFHHITPVLRGRRHAIVGWVHGPTFS